MFIIPALRRLRQKELESKGLPSTLGNMPEDLKKKVYAGNKSSGERGMESIKKNQAGEINGNTILKQKILMLNNRMLKEKFSELENRALETKTTEEHERNTKAYSMNRIESHKKDGSRKFS